MSINNFRLYLFFISSLAFPLYAISTESVSWTQSNTTIVSATSSSDVTTLLYDRYRNEVHYEPNSIVSFTGILDVESINVDDASPYLSYSPDLPFNPTATLINGNHFFMRSHLYRAYSSLNYQHHRATVGYQRIPFGVGRIWTPTDRMNAINPTAIEPSLSRAVAGIQYIYDWGDFSNTQVIMTLDSNSAIKDSGMRLRHHVKGIDTSLTYLNQPNTTMIGLDAERELFNTGAEVRTEWAILTAKDTHNTVASYIFGLDYMFSNGLYMLGEYYHNGETQLSYYAHMLQYQLTMTLSGSTTWIQQLTDGSFFCNAAFSWDYSNRVYILMGALFAAEAHTSNELCTAYLKVQVH